MKRKIVYSVFVTLCAALVSCNRGAELEGFDPGQERDVVLSATIDRGGEPATRVASLTREGIACSWQVNDVLDLVYENQVVSRLTVTSIDGNSAKLAGKVKGAYPKDTEFSLYYGGTNYDYSGQTGTAASAASKAYLQGTVRISRQDNEVLTLGSAVLRHQQAYVSFTFRYGPDELPVKRVTVTPVSAGATLVKTQELGNNPVCYANTSEDAFTVTSAAGLSTVYFAISDLSTATATAYNFSVVAELNGVDTTFTATNSSHFQSGKYYMNTEVVLKKKSDAIATLPAAVAGLMYDTASHELITPGAVKEGAKIWYAVTDVIATDLPSETVWSESVPEATEPGSYMVWYKVDGGKFYEDLPASYDKTTYVDVAIAKRPAAITKPTAVTGLKYTGSAQALVNAGSVKDGVNENFDCGLQMKYYVTTQADPAVDTLYASTAWTTDLPARVNAGTYKVFYRVDGDPHYENVNKPYDATNYPAITVSIGQSDAVIANPEPIVNLIYNGEYQQLVLPADASDGCKVYYHIHESDVDRSVIEAMTQSENWSTEVPMRKNAGTYYVWTKVVDESGADNYTGITGVSATAVVTQIAKANISTSVPTLVSWTYDAEQRNLLSDSLRVIFSSASANTDALKEEVPAVLYFKVTNTTIWADWTAYNPSAPVLPYATDAKSYQVSFKVDGGRNFKSVGETVIGTATVSKANLMYDPAPAAVTETLIYTGQPQTLVTEGVAKYATGHPTKPGEDAVGPVVKYMVADSKPSKNASGWLTTPPAATNAQATYKVWYYVDGGANFNDIDVCSTPVEKGIIKATLMYNPAPAAVTETLVYTGQPQTLITAGEVKYATGHPTMAGQAADGPVLYYMISDSQPSITTEGWQTTLPTATNANSYNVWYKVDGGDNFNNIDVCATPIEKGIGKATLTATADNKQRDYNTANPTFTVTVTGFVNGETASTAAGYVAPTATCSATQSSAAGTYPITVSGGSANNYVFNYVNGTLTINQSVLSITIGLLDGSGSVTIYYLAGESWTQAIENHSELQPSNLSIDNENSCVRYEGSFRLAYQSTSNWKWYVVAPSEIIGVHTGYYEFRDDIFEN